MDRVGGDGIAAERSSANEQEQTTTVCIYPVCHVSADGVAAERGSANEQVYPATVIGACSTPLCENWTKRRSGGIILDRTRPPGAADDYRVV